MASLTGIGDGGLVRGRGGCRHGRGEHALPLLSDSAVFGCGLGSARLLIGPHHVDQLIRFVAFASVKECGHVLSRS